MSIDKQHSTIDYSIATALQLHNLSSSSKGRSFSRLTSLKMPLLYVYAVRPKTP